MITDIKTELKIEQVSSNPSIVEEMDSDEFYLFLYNCYFKWKYTDNRRLANSRKHLDAADKTDDFRTRLYSIKNRIFDMEHDTYFSYEQILKKAIEIPGLGVSGASGLLSIVFPHRFGTVDQFVVDALNSISKPEFNKESVSSMIKNKTSLSIKNAVVLQSIICNKAKQIGLTPRQVDIVLWAVRDKESYHHKIHDDYNWIWMNKKQYEQFYES